MGSSPRVGRIFRNNAKPEYRRFYPSLSPTLRPPRDPKLLAGHALKEAWVVAFAPDGRTIAPEGDDHQVRLREASTGGSRRVLEHRGATRDVSRVLSGRSHAGERHLR